jgi:hypothetical protein
MWGSEFTSKERYTTGGYSRNRSYAERKILDFGGDTGRELPLFTKPHFESI